MNVREYYTYLAAAREQLWNFLRALPEQDLNAALIDGDRFHNIKDLLLHVIDIEDHWVHVIARGDGLEASAFKHDWVKPQAEQYQLSWILDYGKAVQRRTQQFLDTTPDLNAAVKLVQDDPASATATLDQLMWYVMTHEVRHTAQIALLVRQLGHTPPWLDYLRFVRPQTPDIVTGEADLGLDDEDMAAE